MTTEQLENLGLLVQTENSNPDYVSKDESSYSKAQVGPFWVTLENEHVVQIRSSGSLLANCLKLDHQKLSLKVQKKQQLVTRLKKKYSGCAGLASGDGISCSEGLSVLWNAGGTDVRVGL
jgi:hypothetical protein